MKTTTDHTRIAETNIAALVAAYRESVACESWEGYDRDLETPQTLRTLTLKAPAAKIVVFGDETIGIEIEGTLWAAEMPDPLRGHGKQIRLPREVWQWLNFASGHAVWTGDYWLNFGDNDYLRAVR